MRNKAWLLTLLTPLALLGQEIVITSHLGAGFFAELHKVVDNMIYFEKAERFHIDWTQEFFPYKDDPTSNGWDLYFDLIKYNEPGLDLKREVCDVSMHALHDQTCLERWVDYQRFLPYRLSVHDKINECIRIKPEILSEMELVYQDSLKDYFCIGVHVRFASAHIAEAPGSIELSDYIKEIHSLLEKQKNKACRIFLATDSNYVVDVFRSVFKEQLVYIDAFRSRYKEDPHLIYDNADYWLAHSEEFHRKKPGYRGGCTALIDCLLLSKCSIMIHTSSNLADFATFFNPYLESLFLPRNTLARPCQHL